MLGHSILVGNNAENNGGAISAHNSSVFMDSVMFIKIILKMMVVLFL